MSNEEEFSKGLHRKYDLIFLDLGMPIKDGYEACQSIISHYSHISQQKLLENLP